MFAFPAEGRNFNVCMIRDHARISLSLSIPPYILSTIHLLLFYVSLLIIVVKSARRTGRGLLQLPFNPYCSLGPSCSNRPSFPSLAISPIVSPFPCVRSSLSPYRLTPFSPPLSVCHEMHVRTYLVSFPQRKEEMRGETGKEEKEKERERP